MDTARKEKPPFPDFENGQPILDRRAGLLRQFELDRPARLFLDDCCAFAQSSADAYIVNSQAGEVAAPKFAVNRQIEHGEVAFARLNLEPGPDVPDLLWFERSFLTNESSFIPSLMLTGWMLGLGL